MNRHVPHVLVLPEDDANRQLALGFVQEHSVDTRRIQILPVGGGWEPLLECFKRDHVHDMERNPNRFMVLLIDFDEHPDRLDKVLTAIPHPLQGRVFVLGVWTHPEKLRTARGETFEVIGQALARDCRESADTNWLHPLLAHNTGELVKLRQSVQPFLFPAA